MKKLLMISICIAFILNSYAQTQKMEEIPMAAKTAFAQKFLKAEKVKWSIEKPGEYEAEFEIKDVEISVLYDAQGNLLVTETEIKETELPESVKSVLAKDYAGFKIDEVEKAVDAKNIVTYELEAKKDKEKYELVFDANGKLLKKKDKKKGKEDKD